MTSWSPQFAEHPGYEEIAEAIARAIERGDLAPGDRLPTHRTLARQLGVALGTVTRGYGEAGRRGLVVGETGRGTFVRDLADARSTRWRLGEALDESAIDMSLLVAPRAGEALLAEGLRSAVEAVSRSGDLLSLLGYQPHAGAPAHREAAAAWLARTGLETGAARVILCASAQHALAAAVSVVCRPGDVLFVESLTSPGIKDLGAWYPLRLHGLPMDGEGILPDPFEAACRAKLARALHCTPTLQNPTTATMSDGRRRTLAQIAIRHGVGIIEDGVHGLLPRHPPTPLSAYAPDHSYYITSFSKTLAPGVRLGIVQAPTRAVTLLESAVRATLWMASPLLAEIVARWIRDGTALRVLDAKRAEAEARRRLVGHALAGYSLTTQPDGYHAWLRLPARWSAGEFAMAARSRRVLVSPAATFAPAGDPLVEAVRLSFGAPRTHEDLRHGLTVLRELLDRGGRKPVP